MDLQPCQRCAGYRDQEHPRCPARSCGCPCRNLLVDLHSPDTRLVVAQLCQQNSRKLFIKGDSPEVQYVNALISDLLWAEMEALTGGKAHEESEAGSAFTPEEVAGLRYLLEEPRLSEAELSQLRQLLGAADSLLALSARYRDRVAGQAPSYQEEAAPPPQVPPSIPRPRTPPANRKPIPMPNRGAMTMVTRDQSAVAHDLSRRARDRNLNQQLSMSADALMNQTSGHEGELT